MTLIALWKGTASAVPNAVPKRVILREALAASRRTPTHLISFMVSQGIFF